VTPAMSPRSSPSGPGRKAAAIAVSVIALVVVVVVVVTRGGSHIRPLCRVVAPLGHYQLSLDQAANAATIAAVGKTAGLPDHAVSVALAAALQESDLHNLPSGDRDSVGLFQQRPSQGWGPRDQLLKPSYAAGAFYAALEKVPGWETLPVTQAAQMVQRSAAPDAYAPWEQQARAMAEALTGEVTVGLSCQYDSSSTSPASVSLAAAMQNELGSATFTSADAAHQRLVAQWLVAHASSYRITSVTFGSWQWGSGHATWTPLKHAQAQLAVTVAGQSGQAMTAAAAG
ncbi:MAG: hypothetical protein ACRDZY_21590, partial [Acidimicrobiales bacterium]